MANTEKAKKAVFILAAFTLSGAAFYLGQSLVDNNRTGRGPQSIPRSFDYSKLEGDALSLATNDRLVRTAELRKDSVHGLGFTLGNFMLADEAGRPATACEVYSHIEITYMANDMAVSGEIPKMIVKGPCQVDDDPNVIRPLYVLKDQIQRGSVREKSINSQSDLETKIRFENVSDEWPQSWVVESIRLFNDQSREMIVSIDEIRRVRGKTMAFDW